VADAKKILLIDDDEDFVEINRTALEAKGFQVIAAHNGDEGLEMAHGENPDAIVLDVMMDSPTEGFRVAQELRASEAMARIPLIMLTSVNQEGHPWRYEPDEQWLPVDVFLDKPVPAEKLLATINESLAKAAQGD
jgi:two-component system response regulator VicR